MNESEFVPTRLYDADQVGQMISDGSWPQLRIAVDPASPDGDHAGVALYSIAHPSGDLTVHDVFTIPPRLNPQSLERLEIEIRLAPGPEIAFAYSGAEFNEDFGPAALVKLARERQEARWTKKMHNRRRFMRRQRRLCMQAYRVASQ